MKRLAIAAVGLALVATLLTVHEPSVRAQPLASIALPPPRGTVQLYPGCNNIALSFPDGTASQTVVQAVMPAGVVEAMWRHNPAQNWFEGFSPTAPQASDLLTVNLWDAVWLCIGATPPAVATVPSVPPPAAPTTTAIPLPTSTATPIPPPTPTTVSQPCTCRIDQVTAFFEALSPLLKEVPVLIDRAAALLGTGGSLSPVIEDTLSLRSRTYALDAPPCAVFVRDKAVTAMTELIAMMRDQEAGQLSSAVDHLDNAVRLFDEIPSDLDRVIQEAPSCG